MADTKLTDLSAIGTPAVEDLIYIVDDPAGTPVSKKSTLAQIAPVIGAVTPTTVASRPSPAAAGRLFLPTDGFYVERDTGAAWAPWGPIYPIEGVANAPSTWLNQGSAAVDTTFGGVYLNGPTDATLQVRGRLKTAPSTPYTITMIWNGTMTVPGTNAVVAGLFFRQSSDGKLHTFFVGNSSAGFGLKSSKYTDSTTFSAHYLQINANIGTGPIFLRIADNATSRICSWSIDGQHWHVFDTQTRTDFLTADQVGFGYQVLSTSNMSTFGMLVHSWKEA